MKLLKFDHISEVNVMIEVLNHYKHCKNLKLPIGSQVDILLDTLKDVQKLIMTK